MDTTQYLDSVTRESAALADAAERAGLGAMVPSCPGWTVAQLVEHVGNVQRWAARIVATLPDERFSRRDMSESPPPDELLDWFRAATADLVAALRAADPSTPVWTFTPDHTVRFWFRRQAHEVAIHRWDVEGAGSVPERHTGSVPERRTGAVIERGLAVDGIAEWLDFTRVFGAKRHASRDETVHLHCTDTDTDGEGGEWLVTLTSEGAEIEPVHAKGDVAARGTASDLDLFLWGRVGFEALEVFGDAGLLERFRAAGMS